MENPFEKIANDIEQVNQKLTGLMDKIDTLLRSESITKGYVTAEEVMEALKIRNTKLWSMVRQGELNQYNVGKNRLFKIEDVWNYIQGTKVNHDNSILKRK